MIIIDIETIPTGERDKIVLPNQPTKQDVKVGNRKNDTADTYREEQLPSLIKAWEEDCIELKEKNEAQFRRRATIPHKCQAVCWAYCIVSGENLAYNSGFGRDESNLIDNLNKSLARSFRSPYEVNWCGVNIRGFDLPILRQRAFLYKKPFLAQAIPRNPYSDQIIDLMDVFTCGRGKDYLVSKDDMCKFFGISIDDEYTGAQVYDLYLKGDDKSILSHCVKDVLKELELAKRMYVI